MMSKNKKTLQFLSQPVILEESGIPMLNGLIIVAVFLIITSFIVWSVMMEMNEVTTVQGVILAETDTHMLQATVLPEDLGNVQRGQPVKVKISRYETVSGAITEIALNHEDNGQGVPYYEIRAELTHDENIFLRNPAMVGMPVNAEIITGKRSLFQYLVQPVLASRERAFKE